MRPLWPLALLVALAAALAGCAADYDRQTPRADPVSESSSEPLATTPPPPLPGDADPVDELVNVHPFPPVHVQPGPGYEEAFNFTNATFSVLLVLQVHNNGTQPAEVQASMTGRDFETAAETVVVPPGEPQVVRLLLAGERLQGFQLPLDVAVRVDASAPVTAWGTFYVDVGEYTDALEGGLDG